MRFLLLLASLVALSSARADILAFERDGWIYVSDEKGGNLRKLVKGVYPEISPDGTRIAYNTEVEGSTDRLINIVDIATKKSVALPGIPSRNCYGPVWSHDGSKLAFQAFHKDSWGVGIIGVDGSGFSSLKLPAGVTDLWQPIWSADDKSLFCHDLEHIYRLRLDGTLRQKWVASAIAPELGLNSGSRLSASGDGRWLLLDLDMNEDVVMPGWDGPPPCIWKLDLSTGKSTRLTPPGIFLWSPQWAPNNEIYCQSMTKTSAPLAVSKMAMDGSNRSLILKNASSPSLAVGATLKK